MKKTLCVLGIVMGLLCGCTGTQVTPENTNQTAQSTQNDPWEPMNREVFAFNMAADKMVLRPLARGYRAVLPQGIRTGLGNFFKNLHQPVYLLNALLQLEGKQALEITGRFMVNTVFGFFGVADPASSLNLTKYEPDFGQTLYAWGVRTSGPYLMVPFWGPTNIRDGFGEGVDSFATPTYWILRDEPFLQYSRFGVETVSKRESALEFLDSLEQSSTDFYATTRSMWQQNRKNKLDHTNILFGEKQEDVKKDYEFDFPMDDEYDEEE